MGVECGDRKRLAVSAPKSSSSAKAGDPCGVTIMAGGARALDLRLRGDDNREVARMDAASLISPTGSLSAIRLPRRGGVYAPVIPAG